jgi:hypothetical protein
MDVQRPNGFENYMHLFSKPCSRLQFHENGRYASFIGETASTYVVDFTSVVEPVLKKFSYLDIKLANASTAKVMVEVRGEYFLSTLPELEDRIPVATKDAVVPRQALVRLSKVSTLFQLSRELCMSCKDGIDVPLEKDIKDNSFYVFSFENQVAVFVRMKNKTTHYLFLFHVDTMLDIVFDKRLVLETSFSFHQVEWLPSVLCLFGDKEMAVFDTETMKMVFFIESTSYTDFGGVDPSTNTFVRFQSDGSIVRIPLRLSSRSFGSGGSGGSS